MGLRKMSPYTPWHTFGSCCDSCALLWWKLIYLVSDPAASNLPLAIMITIQPYYVTDRSWRDCLWMRIQYLGRSKMASVWKYDMSYCHNRLNSNIQYNLSSHPSLFFSTHISDNKVEEFLSNVDSDLEKSGHSLKWFIRQSGVITLFLPFLRVPSSNDK